MRLRFPIEALAAYGFALVFPTIPLSSTLVVNAARAATAKFS